MGYYPQESLYKPYKYHGYTVRGTPNCPLKYRQICHTWILWLCVSFPTFPGGPFLVFGTSCDDLQGLILMILFFVSCVRRPAWKLNFEPSPLSSILGGGNGAYPPKFSSSPVKSYLPNGKGSSSNHLFFQKRDKNCLNKTVFLQQNDDNLQFHWGPRKFCEWNQINQGNQETRKHRAIQKITKNKKNMNQQTIQKWGPRRNELARKRGNTNDLRQWPSCRLWQKKNQMNQCEPWKGGNIK